MRRRGIGWNQQVPLLTSPAAATPVAIGGRSSDQRDRFKEECHSKSIFQGLRMDRSAFWESSKTEWCSAEGMFLRLASSCLSVSTDFWAQGSLAEARSGWELPSKPS